MLPLKDNLPTDRVPLVTIALVAASLLAPVWVDDGTLWAALAVAAGLWLFGVSVEDAMARWRYLLLCALGAAAAVGLHAALGGDGAAAWAGAAGAAATAVAAHLSLYPRAKIVSIAFTGLFLGLYEVPSWLLAGVWTAAQLALALTGAGGAGEGLAAWAWVAGALVGAAAVRPLVQRRKALVPASRPGTGRAAGATAAVRP